MVARVTEIRKVSTIAAMGTRKPGLPKARAMKPARGIEEHVSVGAPSDRALGGVVSRARAVWSVLAPQVTVTNPWRPRRLGPYRRQRPSRGNQCGVGSQDGGGTPGDGDPGGVGKQVRLARTALAPQAGRLGGRVVPGVSDPIVGAPSKLAGSTRPEP